MPPRTDQLPPRVFPYSGLLLLMLVSVGISWVLVPRQDQLVDRLFKDQQYARIASLLQSELGAETSGFSSVSLRHLTSDQLTFLSHLVRLTPREQLRSVFTKDRPPAYDIFVHGLMLAAIRYVNVVKPAEAWDLIQIRLSQLSGKQQQDLTGILSQNAFALNDPRLASEILTVAAQSPHSTAATAKSMAEAYRWSNQPEAGAKRLFAWLQNAPDDDPTALRDLATLTSDMALAGSNPSLALDAKLWSLDHRPNNTPLTDAEMNSAYTLALQSTRTTDLLPHLTRYVASLPQANLDWRDLLAQSRRQPTQLADYRRWLELVAQIADWNSQFETAFDLHFRLAAMGKTESLDRCLALTAFLGRGQQTAPLLQSMEALPSRPRLQIELARLLAALGDDVGARSLFEDWITHHADDRDARFDYSNLLLDMGMEAESRNALAALVDQFPSDTPAIKALAQANIREARYSEALDLYTRLPPPEHDPATLENYALLAESLDRHVDLYNALHLLLTLTADPSVALYQDLVEAAAYLADPAIAIRSLEDGLQKHPNSIALRISLAAAWIEAGDAESGITILMQNPALRDHFEAVTLAVSSAPEVVRPTALLDFVGNDLDQRFSLPTASLIDFAVLLGLAGDPEKSEALFASIPEIPETTRLLAEGYHNKGDDDEAARLMTAHLQNNPRATAKEWLFLGELFESLGREEDAQRAYNYSLALLTAELPDTAYQQPVMKKATPPTN